MKRVLGTVSLLVLLLVGTVPAFADPYVEPDSPVIKSIHISFSNTNN